MHIINDWFKRHFSDPQLIILVAILLVATVVIVTMGQTLAPVLAGLFIAYLLDGMVSVLERLHLPRLVSVIVIFVLFMALMIFILFGLLPMLSVQIGQFVKDLPSMFKRGNELLMRLPSRYPDIISQEQVIALMNILQTELGHLGQRLLSY